MAAWEFQTLQNIAEKHNWHKFVSMQDLYNLLYREEGTYHPEHNWTMILLSSIWPWFPSRL